MSEGEWIDHDEGVRVIPHPDGSFSYEELAMNEMQMAALANQTQRKTIIHLQQQVADLVRALQWCGQTDVWRNGEPSSVEELESALRAHVEATLGQIDAA